MLNYRKIRAALMKKFEKGNEISYCAKDDALYVAIFDFMLVRFPPNENPYDVTCWNAVPGMERNLEDANREHQLTVTNRYQYGMDDMLHLLRTKEKTAWISERAFSLLAKADDCDFFLSEDGKRVWFVRKDTGDVEAVVMAAHVEE